MKLYYITHFVGDQRMQKTCVLSDKVRHKKTHFWSSQLGKRFWVAFYLYLVPSLVRACTQLD